MKTFLLNLVALCLMTNLTAQFLNKADSTWKIYNKQLLFGSGGTQFLGDLGGASSSGNQFGISDLDYRATSWQIHTGFRYQFHPLFATHTALYFGQYKASDWFTSNEKRNHRNINIKSTIIELSQRIEFVFYSKYKTRTNKEQKKTSRFHLFAYTGLGLTYFNPQAGVGSKHEGIYLRNLSTEGQGHVNGIKEYSIFTASIPFGFGLQKSFSRRRSFRVEFSYMKTFSDYMDDTSGKYYSYEANNVTTSPETVYFSNPSGDWTTIKNGDSRGGKGKDCYFFASVSFVKAMGMRTKKIRTKI